MSSDKWKVSGESLMKQDSWQSQGPVTPKIQGHHTTQQTCVGSVTPFGGCGLDPCHYDNKEP